MSGLNGKISFDAGALTLPAPMFVARAAGTLTVPLGDRFGLQADVMVSSAPGFSASAAVHGFTRDPQSYLIGGTLGIMRTPGAVVVAAGPEAELYFDRWTVEAWGGLAVTHPNAGATRTGPFVMGDVAYYATDNLRLNLGLSALDGYAAVHFGSEYLVDDFSLPFAITTEARLGQDGAVRATVGLRAYLGAPHKTLIRRHREDDPSDRGMSLSAAAGGPTVTPAKPHVPPATPPRPDPPVVQPEPEPNPPVIEPDPQPEPLPVDQPDPQPDLPVVEPDPQPEPLPVDQPDPQPDPPVVEPNPQPEPPDPPLPVACDPVGLPVGCIPFDPGIDPPPG